MIYQKLNNFFHQALTRVDWLLLAMVVLLASAGLVTMNSFTAESYFFERQVLWLGLSTLIFIGLSLVDVRFLRRSGVVAVIFFSLLSLLGVLLLVGDATRGAKSWFDFGPFAFQPVDFMKLGLILILSKYFSRRHIEIANFRHIFISGIYALIPFVLVLLQPDFGSAVIIFLIWLGMILASGVSKRHILGVFTVSLVLFAVAWLFLFAPYQKARIISFIHPLADLRGAGYNAFQSMIAIGSGQLFGKGIGYGTQSRLQFLPEYETDFIFAAFAEEWGFVGVIFLFVLYNLVIWRILKTALMGETNFETLFGVGLAVVILSHFVINVGMNMGLLPVTGLTLPFVSYGGSHLLATFAGLGILSAMRRYSRVFHREDLKNEFLGI